MKVIYCVYFESESAAMVLGWLLSLRGDSLRGSRPGQAGRKWMTVVTSDLSRKMGHPSQNHSQAEIVPKNGGWAKKGILYPTDWFIFEGANGVRTKECTLFNPDHPLNTEEAILSCSELEAIQSLEPRPPASSQIPTVSSPLF